MNTAKALQTLTTAEDAGLTVRAKGDELTVSGRLDPRPLALLRDLKRDKAGIVYLLHERNRSWDYGRLGNAPTVVLPAGLCVVCFRPVRRPGARLCDLCNRWVTTRAGQDRDTGTAMSAHVRKTATPATDGKAA